VVQTKQNYESTYARKQITLNTIPKSTYKLIHGVTVSILVPFILRQSKQQHNLHDSSHNHNW